MANCSTETVTTPDEDEEDEEDEENEEGDNAPSSFSHRLNSSYKTKSDIQHDSIGGVIGWTTYTCSFLNSDDDTVLASQDVVVYHYDPNEGSN